MFIYMCNLHDTHLSLFIIHVFASTDATHYLPVQFYSSTEKLVNPLKHLKEEKIFTLEIESFICTKMRFV